MNFILFMFFCYISLEVFSGLKKIKILSLENKISFIDDFKKLGYCDHNFYKNNYEKIKKEMEKRCDNFDYIKSQDILYASVIFKSRTDSNEYKQALKGKEDVLNIYRNIEFDALRICFAGICKSERINIVSRNISKEAKQKHRVLLNHYYKSIKISDALKKFKYLLIALSISEIFLFLTFLIK